MNIENDKYKTKDLHEAAFLYAKKKNLLCLQLDGRSYYFVYSDKKDCQKIAAGYWKGYQTISGIEFSNAVRILKERVFNLKSDRFKST